MSTRGDSVPRQGTCLDERRELHWVEIPGMGLCSSIRKSNSRTGEKTTGEKKSDERTGLGTVWWEEG